jgi:hypothetical protein
MGEERGGGAATWDDDLEDRAPPAPGTPVRVRTMTPVMGRTLTSEPTSRVRDEPPRAESWIDRHDAVVRFAQLLALSGLTIAQPVLDSFAESPETFVYRRASTTDVVLFATLVTLALPTVLWLVEELAGLIGRPARSAVHLAFVAGLFGVMGWQLVERNAPDSGDALHLAGVAALGTAGTAVIVWFRWARGLLGLLGLSPLIVATAWLATGPVHEVAFAEGPGTAHGVAVEDPAPIVMVVLDELPTASLLDESGHVDETLFPGFARLAGDATWYRNTTTVSPTTPEAVPALLTGRYPGTVGQPPTAASHPDNMFRALQGTYELNVWELVAQLCPPDQCPAQGGAVDRGLGALLADAADLWGDWMDEPPPSEDQEFAIRQSDPESPRKFEEFISSLSTEDQPRLDFIHLALPHQPWRHLPSGARHDAPFLAEGLGAPNYSWKDDYFAAAGRQRHLLQLQRADGLLAQMLRRLDDLDRYDESLIVVTADHGVAFDTGEPIRGVSEGNLEQVMWVPLLVKAPGQQEGEVDDRPMQTIDVFPTIADLIGMDIPWSVDGRPGSVARSEADDERRLYPWKLNEIVPPDDRDHATIDGAVGFDRLFDVPPAGSAPRDDLQLYRFGEWGSLIGEEAAAFDTGEESSLSIELQDADGDAVGRDHFRVAAGQAVVPVYVRGEIDDLPPTFSSDPAELVVVVNGFVGGWGRAFSSKGVTQFFSLVPQELLAVGANDVEVFELAGTPERPVLGAVAVRWDDGAAD